LAQVCPKRVPRSHKGRFSKNKSNKSQVFIQSTIVQNKPFRVNKIKLPKKYGDECPDRNREEKKNIMIKKGNQHLF